MGDNDKEYPLSSINSLSDSYLPLQSVYFDYDCSTSHFGAVNINTRVEEKISRNKNSWLPEEMMLSPSPPVADLVYIGCRKIIE